MNDGFSYPTSNTKWDPISLADMPGQPLSVQDFLRSLKKSTRPLPTPKCLEAPQANTPTSCQLTVQGFLHGLRKPVSPPCELAEAAEAPKLKPSASTGHGELPFIDSTVPGPGLLGPSESIPNEIDREQVLSPLPEARILRYPNPTAADEKAVSKRIPKVVRTYAKRIKHVSEVRKDNSTLFLTQSSTHEGALLDRLFDDGSDAPIKRQVSREIPKTKPAKKHTPASPRKSKRQLLLDDEEIRREDYSEDDADTVISGKKIETKRKKRRAPVNGLALVTDLPSHQYSPAEAQKFNRSDNAIDLLNEYHDEQGFPALISPSLEESRKSRRVGISKPVTRIRQEITMSQREALTQEGFKFPPTTPRATKSPGWRLGSGFEGTTLEPSANKRLQTLGNRKVRHARTPIFPGQSLSRLEISSRLSPPRQPLGQRGISKRQKDHGGPVSTRQYEPARKLGTADGAVEDGLPHKAVQTGGKTAFEQVAGLALTAVLRAPTENNQSQTASSFQPNGVVREPVQLHQSQTRDLNTSETIRAPSRSERNDWLKRRKVVFPVADEDEDREQPYFHTRRISVNADEHGRRNGINGSDTDFGDTAHAQHAIYNDLHASNGRGQTAPNPEQPATNQQQEVFQAEQSAEQHKRRSLHDAEEQGSEPEDDILDHQSSSCPPEAPSSSESEAEFPTSPLHAEGLSMPKVRHHIGVSWTSEVPDTEERPRESINLDHTGTEYQDLGIYPCRIPAITLDSGKYSSKAVQQLDSPEKVPHTITRRRSRREPNQDVRCPQVMLGTQEGAHHVTVAPITGGQRSQNQKGDLEYGVTPSLKRKMSNVPLRPPFKEPL